MSVLLAMGITVAVVVVLTIFACQTKYDFTGFGPYELAALLIFIVFFSVLHSRFHFSATFLLVSLVSVNISLSRHEYCPASLIMCIVDLPFLLPIQIKVLVKLGSLFLASGDLILLQIIWSVLLTI